MEETARDWAREQFATADFGDVRRTWRASAMLRRAAERPAGELMEVFKDVAELQAAYDFVEGRVRPDAIVESISDATLRRAADEPVMYVVVDGTSVTLTDRQRKKGFGSIGKRTLPTRGLKVINALALGERGVPLGMLDLRMWTRQEKSEQSRLVRRKTGVTEISEWTATIERCVERAATRGVQPWFVIDREGDCADILRAVSRNRAQFTVRAGQDRLLVTGRGETRLRTVMKRKIVVAKRAVSLRRTSTRAARVATLDIRVAKVTLSLPNHRAGGRRVRDFLPVHVVWARERKPPRGAEAVDWMLFTSAPIDTPGDALSVLDSYCFRWRIEDFHRTWKSGHCRVEDTQLRHVEHVKRWITMLAAVATRVERLKHLARTQPAAPASIELSPIEIQALRVQWKLLKKRTEPEPPEMPTMGDAVYWIARCGSYHGKLRIPGSVTVARGLADLLIFASGLEAGLKLARR